MGLRNKQNHYCTESIKKKLFDQNLKLYKLEILRRNFASNSLKKKT